MIEFLRLEDLGIIQESDVEIAAGLTVLTGETGAGKTMVLTAIDLLLGARPVAGLAMSPNTRVQGGWSLNADHPIVSRIEDLGGVVHEGELLITRTLPSNGRSRCSVGGAVVPQPVLAEIGAQLIAVHGQADQSLLRKESEQRALLDRFAGDELEHVLGQYRNVFERVR